MPFAEVDSVVWQALIAAGLAVYMEWSRRRTTDAVREVRKKVDSVEAGVEVVHKATNSLTEQLVKKTEEEALARGGVQERARADARKDSAT